MYSSVRAAMSSSRGVTHCRHPTNGRAIRRSPAGPLDLTRSAQVEAASSSLPATFQKENTILTDGVSFWSGRRGATRYRHPTNGRAIRRSPAGPLDLTRCAQVEAARSSLPAAFQKENTILTDGVSFCDCPQVLLSALPPTARKGECEGGTFDGFPHSRSITRPQATTFAKQKCCTRNKATPKGWLCFWCLVGDLPRKGV